MTGAALKVFQILVSGPRKHYHKGDWEGFRNEVTKIFPSVSAGELSDLSNPKVGHKTLIPERSFPIPAGQEESKQISLAGFPPPVYNY